MSGASKRLLLGTTNVGKVRQMRAALAPLGLTLDPVSLEGVAEVGASAEEVAANKARSYSSALGGDAVLALDHWLHLDGVPPELQPLGHVRRIPGHPDGASEDELVAYYRALAAGHGGAVAARWDLGVAVARGDDVKATTITVERRLVSTPSAVRLAGLPLSSLQIDVTTGKYVSEHEAEDEVALWQRVYGPGLCEFVTSSLLTTS